MARSTVLVIDDEKDLYELISYNLEKEGFVVRGALDGESGLAAARDDLPDLILVDLMLPGMDGFEVCRRLRSESRTASIPIIMLTAKSGESDRVLGLELGADDYVTKPFSPREVAARVKAVLRRAAPRTVAPSVIRHGNLVIDMTRREVSCEGDPIQLTASEFRILHFLAVHPGQVFSRSELIDGAMGRDVTVVDRTIDVHITGVRKKLGPCGELIETVRGFGYRFRS
ncbi:MAG: response regulator transcription factor [Acidobacteria bacterium]|nr:response regulator transcription factor [Acidobacteriota bacterium]